MKNRTYLVAKDTGKRHYLTLAPVHYDRSEFDLARSNLKNGIRPDKSTIKRARAIGSKLLRLKQSPWFFSSEGQHKMELSNRASKGVLKSFVMHLAPANSSGYQVCHGASKGCIESCLNLAGHGPIANVQAGRIKRTKLYFEHRSIFAILLWDMLDLLSRRKYAVSLRLNGTSDLPWEIREPWVFEMFPSIIFYDYSKIPGRFKRPRPENYSLTFSRSESNHAQAMDLLNAGESVAIVFDYATWGAVKARKNWFGYPVIDGSADDRRWLDPKGSIVALKPLGPAKHDTSGFVLRNSLKIINQGV